MHRVPARPSHGHHTHKEDGMKTAVKRSPLFLIAILSGLFVLTLPAFAPTDAPTYAMDPGSMKMEDTQGSMMQKGTMTADEMIKKGDELIAEGKALKKKGMMMKKGTMDKGMMKKQGMMKGNEMKKDAMGGMDMGGMK
jgi:hypothetical protein